MNIGEKAPEMLGINEKGEKILLSQYQGKKIVLYFYPKDNTSGCTAEACSLRDNYAALKEKGYEVIGVSVDNEKSHQKFIEKYELPLHSSPIRTRNWWKPWAYGAKRACTDANTWVLSAPLSSSTKRESSKRFSFRKRSRPRHMPNRF